MILQELLNTLTNPDRLRIFRGEKEVYTGYLAMLMLDNQLLYDTYRHMEIKRLRAVPEIRHKKWKKLGLTQPLEPDQTPQYSFSDLQMSLYYTIYL